MEMSATMPMYFKPLLKLFFNYWYKVKPPEMVQYWRYKESNLAKVGYDKHGAYQMMMKGEKYPYPGYPRGHVLMGSLARMKFVVKNVVFNHAYKMMEEGKTPEQVADFMKDRIIPQLVTEILNHRHDFLPPEKCVKTVRELHRAMSVVENTIQHPSDRYTFSILKEGLCFFLQEDDSYRNRLQWIAPYVNPNNIIRRIWRTITFSKYSLAKEISIVFKFVEDAEITDDMKGRIKLIKTVLTALMSDKDLRGWIEAVAKEMKWRRIYLTKADKYFFRGKYYKVDHGHFDY